ncbi:MAG: PD40 domain-containing protein [Salinivirgaceae bacterium]|nr:PD40 domain-containing protein [Salinivirgaceae bacterium]
MMIIKRIIYIIILIGFSIGSYGQLSPSERRVLKTANNLFDNEEFDKALPLFLKIDSLTEDYQIQYRIGACYLNTKYERLKALPFLEKISKLTTVEVPLAVYYDLGGLYHYTYRFDEAIAQFEKFLKYSNENDYSVSQQRENALRMKTICIDAIEITTQQYKAEVDIIGYPINSMESEFCPMITADENTMIFMKTIGISKIPYPETSIMITHQKRGGYWTEPQKLEIENIKSYKDKTILLAGLSPDGNIIFLNIGEGLNQDIYHGTIENNTIIDIKKLNKNINTPYYEGRASISSDGTTLYFVSDRPGGFGSTDIYKATLNRRGDWDTPVNMGNVINTKFNENSPFMHPDNVTLFFSSEGHKTIGGNDIFKSKIDDNIWSKPENLGFLNSPKDDLYFVLNASGQTGYFSTSKNNIYDKHNIFKVTFNDPIPLTLVKGTIRAGNPPKPIGAEIKVYDKETGIRIKYVYNPDPETGKYLMIFPPAKNYNLVISSGEFLPQLINVYIPYQTYFYELYQEITLQPVTVDNNVIGEKVTVNNTFYDLYKTTEADSILIDNLPKQPKYYDHLLELIENIIQTTDTMKISYLDEKDFEEHENNNIESLLNLIEEAIETTDPVTLTILDANARQKDKVKSTLFYTNGDMKKSLKPYIIGMDTIYVANPIETQNNNKILETQLIPKIENKEETENQFRLSKESDRNYLHKYEIYYEVNQDEIPQKSINQLNQICRILIDNPVLGAEIFGYTDTQGEEKYNLSLSKQRAQKILKYFIDYKVDKQKLIAKGFGEGKSVEEFPNSWKNRKVEINIFELKK